MIAVIGAGYERGRPMWLCRCDCGTEKMIRGEVVRKRQHCGCKGRKAERHGMTDTPAYKSWSSMMSRCRNPKAPDYADYGGRGIRVCNRWSSFTAFHLDMGDRPPGTTLDRIDPDENYEPSNCRWSDAATQAANKRASRRRVRDIIEKTKSHVIGSSIPSYSRGEVVDLLNRLLSKFQTGKSA